MSLVGGKPIREDESRSAADPSVNFSLRVWGMGLMTVQNLFHSRYDRHKSRGGSHMMILDPLEHLLVWFIKTARSVTRI